MAKKGRPPVYTAELAAEICARIAAGESLRKICETPGIPAASTVHLWVIDNTNGFAEQYTRARLAQAIRWAEEIKEIADDGSNDTYVDADGNTRTDHDVINRSRLRVDTRKWLLSKVLPKVYGEKVNHEVTGADGGPVVVTVALPPPPE